MFSGGIDFIKGCTTGSLGKAVNFSSHQNTSHRQANCAHSVILKMSKDTLWKHMSARLPYKCMTVVFSHETGSFIPSYWGFADI